MSVVESSWAETGTRKLGIGFGHGSGSGSGTMPDRASILKFDFHLELPPSHHLSSAQRCALNRDNRQGISNLSFNFLKMADDSTPPNATFVHCTPYEPASARDMNTDPFPL